MVRILLLLIKLVNGVFFDTSIKASYLPTVNKKWPFIKIDLVGFILMGTFQAVSSFSPPPSLRWEIFIKESDYLIQLILMVHEIKGHDLDVVIYRFLHTEGKFLLEFPLSFWLLLPVWKNFTIPALED